jgi:2-polyprenyl-3-methyl-5-hydroxy-6-metoxy-1,4-benzoquinol methylase
VHEWCLELHEGEEVEAAFGKFERACLTSRPPVLSDPLLEARQTPPLHGDRATLLPGNIATLIFTVAQVHLLPFLPIGRRGEAERGYMRRHRDARLNVINAYEDLLVRAYCLGRFWILRQRFLDEIGQYLPARGRVVDLGCGFGLFSLYYASVRPGLELEGFDLDSRRIAMAQAAARRLGLENVRYRVGNVMDFRGSQLYDAGYMLDIVHHIPAHAVRPLLEQIAKALPPGARLLVKDVDRKPAYKRWFTHALDKLMDPLTPVSYWAAEELQDLLEEVGFSVYRHLMVDILPYPHVLYVCERTGGVRP